MFSAIMDRIVKMEYDKLMSFDLKNGMIAVGKYWKSS